jgi:hypothetical protein
MAQSKVKSTEPKRVVFAISMLFFVMAVAMGAIQRNVSQAQTIEVEGLFTFRLPPGWSKRSSFNVNEVRGEWVKGGTKLVYAWGRTESGDYGERRQSWMNDYEETTTRLGGRRANIRGFSSVKDGKRTYQAELNVGNWENGEVQLYMRIEGSDLETLELAKEIFKSVKLPIPSPERPAPQ